MLVLSSQSASYLLQFLFAGGGAGWRGLDTWFHLYINNATLGPDMVLGSFVEPIWTDYAPLDVSTWTPAIWTGTVAAVFADQTTWQFPGTSAPVSVHGYFVSDGLTGPLLWAEDRPGGPLVLAHPGDTCSVYPQFTLGLCPPA